jgi:NCS1 family nucleobase:cation symporter-1
MFSVVVATLAVNIAANVVSPANDFANALPKLISFKTGGLLTGLIGIAMQPWRLLADPKGYIFSWLVGYSGGLGSIAGVLIADYWIVRRAHTPSRRSLPAEGRVRRLERARRDGHAGRMRAGLGRTRDPGAAPAL